MTNGITFPLDVLQYMKMIANTVLETTQLSIFQSNAFDNIYVFMPNALCSKLIWFYKLFVP